MRVRPTVSELDFSLNSDVPALRSRSAETTVELGSGQSFMIAGLLSNSTSNNINKVPGLGNIPIRSEEHTSELQSLMRISYAVFCLKQNNSTNNIKTLNIIPTVSNLHK